MTYRDLANDIAKMSDEQKDSTLTILENDEYFRATLQYAVDTDILDEYHPVITKE